MKSVKLSLCGALALLVVLPGCVKEYKKITLKPLSKQSAQFEQTKSDVTLRVKKFDADDCREAFSGRGKNFTKGRRALYPLHVSVENKGAKDVILSSRDINLPLVPAELAIRRLQLSSGNSAVMAGLLGGFLGIYPGMGIAQYGFCIWKFTNACLIGNILMATGVFVVPLLAGVIPATWQGRAARTFNKALDADLQTKALNDLWNIKAGQSFDRLIFVAKKDYRNNFSITLKNAAGEKDAITFDVVLPEED